MSKKKFIRDLQRHANSRVYITCCIKEKKKKDNKTMYGRKILFILLERHTLSTFFAAYFPSCQGNAERKGERKRKRKRSRM